MTEHDPTAIDPDEGSDALMDDDALQRAERDAVKQQAEQEEAEAAEGEPSDDEQAPDEPGKTEED